MKRHLIRGLLFLLLLMPGGQLEIRSRGIRAVVPAFPSDRMRLRRLEHEFEQLRMLLQIPGMSAAIVKDQQILWAKGFGYADLEKRIPAKPNTLYYIASLTKTFAATVLMQFVEQGKLDLNEPMSKYSDEFKDDTVKIKHVLSHTSSGVPGDRFRYDGARFSLLTAVIEKKAGKPFRDVMTEMFLEPLKMSDSVPSRDVFTAAPANAELFGKDKLDRYQRSLNRYAKPYRLYGNEIVHTTYPWEGISTSAGLLSTAPDLAKFDIAIDRHVYINQETQNEAWTPFVSNGGQSLVHGLGWFVQTYHGLRCIWHFGNDPNEFSATYVKLPDNGLSLIILANSDVLSTTFLRGGILTTSPFVAGFLRIFIFEDRVGQRLPDLNWLAKPEEFANQLARVRRSTKEYSYEAEEKGYAAIRRWLENNRRGAFKPVEIAPQAFEYCLGQYQLSDGTTFTVSSLGGRLLIRQQDAANIELFAQSSTRFFTKAVDAEFEFIKDSDGRVNQMHIYQDRQIFIAKKIK